MSIKMGIQELLSSAVALSMLVASGRSVCFSLSSSTFLGTKWRFVFQKAAENGWYLYRTLKMLSPECYSDFDSNTAARMRLN